MRATSKLIEPAAFRHKGSFKSYTQDLKNNDVVPSRTLSETIPVWYSFLSGSGLLMGQMTEIEVNQDWQQMLLDDSILFRFSSLLLREFFAKKSIFFETMGREYSLVKLQNINGESIYHLARLEAVK